MPRFRNIEDKHPDFLRGYGFQGGASMEKWGHAFALPGFGAAFKQQVRDDRPWNMNFSGFGECLARYENFCEIDKEKVDAWGIPVLHISMAHSDNEKKMIKDMADTAEEMLRAMGAEDVKGRADLAMPGLAIHEVGTARMGNDPEDLGAEPLAAGARGQEPVRDGRRRLPELGLPEPDAHHDGARRARLRAPGGRVQARQPLRRRERQDDAVAFRLGVMMFLEYVVWGAWLPLLGNYLGQSLKFSGGQQAWIFATPAVASVFALFVGGQIADRYLSGEKVLLICHALCGVLMFAMGTQTGFAPILVLMLLWQLFYVPTLSVTNSIAFHHLAGREREFGRVRLWGTIGWIAASWPYVILLDGKTPAETEKALGTIFLVSGGRIAGAGGVLVLAAQDAAQEGAGGRGRAAQGAQAAGGARVRSAVRGHPDGRDGPPGLLPVHRHVPGEGRPGRALDSRRDEHRPDRRDRARWPSWRSS